MTDVKVEHCDRALYLELGIFHTCEDRMILSGWADETPEMQKIARHRQAAEKAQQERDAALVEAYAEKTDADLLRWYEDDEAVAVITGRGIAATEIATAIRSQGHE